ncbi:hypothetical protein [Corynebacterium sp.]|jgi:hypothetical protein|uniref:hypothetical protein n=1 Tax=Corynebacterium sp. TaxID=1720 RepID=UPI0025BB66CB|nr:hypothetical protein [Corynebacterium sp.]
MNDRDMESVNGAGDADAVIRLDRLLDAVAAGERPETDDRLLGLLADARAELDAADTAAPVTPPDINALLDADAAVTPIDSGRHRRGLGFTGRAAAAGGISVTGMVIAGGVAAAIAVGGFGVAAYHGAIPGIPARNEVVDGRQNHPEDETVVGSGSERSSTPGASSSSASESASDEPSESGTTSATESDGSSTGTESSTDPTEGGGTTEPTEGTDESGEPSDPDGTEAPGEGEDPTWTEPETPGGTSDADVPSEPGVPSTDKVDDGTTGQAAAGAIAGS